MRTITVIRAGVSTNVDVEERGAPHRDEGHQTASAGAEEEMSK
jgi:hypothetical protein